MEERELGLLWAMKSKRPSFRCWEASSRIKVRQTGGTSAGWVDLFVKEASPASPAVNPSG